MPTSNEAASSQVSIDSAYSGNSGSEVDPLLTSSKMSVVSLFPTDYNTSSKRFKPSASASWKARYIWDSFDKSPEERWFLFKLDSVLLTLASLGYFIKVRGHDRFGLRILISGYRALASRLEQHDVRVRQWNEGRSWYAGKSI